MKMLGTRISQDEVARRRYRDFVPLAEGMSYAVLKGQKHQIISSEGRDVGIVFSDNGEKDFRRFNHEVVYWFTGPYTYLIHSRKVDTIEVRPRGCT